MTYVTMREDKFGRLKSKITKLSAEDKPKSSNVRRPLHGMELYGDTYATITVRTSRGSALNVLADTSTPEESVYGNSSTTNLIVQRIDESRQEKQQIIETFGEDFVYYYGQRPRMLQVNAILPDSLEFQYAQEFWTNYDRALRGTKLVMRDARVFLDIAGQIFEGYLSTAQTTRSADQPRIIQLNFTMYITHSYYVRPLENGKYARSVNQGTSGSGIYSDEYRFFKYNKSMLGDYLQISTQDKISSVEDAFVLKDSDLTNKTLLTLLRAKDAEVKVYDYIALVGPPREAMSFAKIETGSDIYGAKAVPETNLSKALSGLSSVLSVAASGLIVAGAVGAVVDGVNEAGGIKDYFNTKVVDTILDEIDTFLTDAGDIATGLLSAGYSIIDPDKSLSDSEFFTTEETTYEQYGDPDTPITVSVSDPEVLVFISAPTSLNTPTVRDRDVNTYQNDDTFTNRLIL